MTARSRLAALPFAALLAFSTALPAFAASDSTVIAIVNGKKIERKEVDQAAKRLQLQMQMPQRDARTYFADAVEMLINQHIIDEAAAKENIKGTDDFKKRLDALNQEIDARIKMLEEQKTLLPVEIARQLYVEKRIKDKVSEKAVKDEYNKFRLENEGKVEMNASHIVVKTKEEADQIIKELNEGRSFGELAKQRSSGATAGADGDLGWFTREGMIPEFSDPVFKLKKGEWSKEPFQTRFGWHVAHVKDRRTREVPPFDKVKDAFRAKLTEEGVASVIKKLREKAKVEMYDEKGRELNFPASGQKAEAPGEKKDEAQ